MNSTKQILIIRLSSIGDILLSTPFIRQTRIAFPEAQIDFVVKKRFVELVQYNPHLNHIYSFDEALGFKGLLELRKTIQQKNYDYVLDLHNNLRSRLLTFGQRAKVFRMKKDKIKRALLVYFKINLFKEVVPIAEKYLRVGQALGIKDDQQGLELCWKDGQIKRLQKKLSSQLLKKPFIALAPGAGFKTKQWPIEYFRSLVQKIENSNKFNVVLLGNLQEREQFRPLEISQIVFNLAGKLSLLESAIVLNRARILVSNDSGLMHMATAVKTPVLAIFGSTVKELGFFPYRSKSMVLENNNLWCRPCSHIGRNRCPLGHMECLKTITPEIVFEKLSLWM